MATKKKSATKKEVAAAKKKKAAAAKKKREAAAAAKKKVVVQIAEVDGKRVLRVKGDLVDCEWTKTRDGRVQLTFAADEIGHVNKLS